MPPKYNQNYRTEWEKMLEFKEWLQPADNDPTRAYCKYCKCNIIAKLYYLKQHLASSKHLKAVEPLKSQRKIEFPTAKRNLNTEKAEGTLALFICEHASIMAVDHLSQVCKKTFSDSQCSDLRIHRTKCTQIIKNVLAPHFVREMVADIGDQEYSLLLDESTDISVTKLLGITIRYFSRSLKKIISTFLGLVEIEDGTANSIVKGLKTLVTTLKLDMKKLIGISTDNASVMTGTNNGVYELLKKETGNKSLVLVRCICHSLQLAMSHASEESLPRNIEYLIRETYNWFSHSSNRQLYYKELYKTMNCGSEPLKIPQLCNTRWISIEHAVCRILEQWVELKLLFEVARRKENCYMAETLYQMYNDPVNHLYLLYIKPILQEVQVVNKLFESNNVDPTKLYKDLTGLTESISRRIINPSARVDVLTEDIESYLDPSPYMGYSFESNLREYNLETTVIQNLRQRCINFTLKLVKELQARLPLNFRILQTTSMFSVEETLKVLKPSIIGIAEEFIQNPETLDKIVTQWTNIVCIQWKSTSTIEFWTEVLDNKDAAGNNPFKELATFAITLLSLPYSNAEVERVFSQMNVVKTKLRNRLATTTLNAILYVRFGLKRIEKCCHSYNFPEEMLRIIGTRATYGNDSLLPDSIGTASTSSTQPITMTVDENLLIDENIDILFN